MIISKSAYDAGFTDYQPYALPNTAITPALVECVDNGKKNLLNVTTITTGNITFTPDDDGYVTASPNNTDTRGWTYASAQYKVYLKPATYVCVLYIKTASSAGGLGVSLRNTSDTAIFSSTLPDLQNKTGIVTFTFTITTEGSYGLMIKQYDMVARFMICTEAEYKASQTYQPFALSNVELTERVTSYGSEIVANSDLNNFTIIGEYFCTTTYATSTLSNLPTIAKSTNGHLTVKGLNTGNSTRLTQIWYCNFGGTNTGGIVLIRQLVADNQWSAWYQFTGTALT